MYTQACGEDRMTVKGEGRPLQPCVIVHTSTITSVHIIHTYVTSVFSFTMFTATTVLSNSIEDCITLEINPINYPGIQKIHQEIYFSAG